MIFQYTAAHGVPPYTFEVLPGSGDLPPGVALDPDTGELSATGVTSTGTYAFTIRVTDSLGDHADQPDEITISTADALDLTGGAPEGETGVFYTFAYTTTGGAGPYTYAVTTGTLPAGLTLSSSTGVLSGVPTTIETQAFTVTVTDGGGFTDHVDESIEVISGGSVVGHRYWRINLIAGNGYVGSQIAELEFRGVPGGPDLTDPITALTAAYASNTFNPTFAPAKAFDDSAITVWFSDLNDAQKLAYDFGSPVVVSEISLMPIPTGGTELTIAAKDFNVEWSDDNSGWTVAWEVRGETSWTAGEARIYFDTHLEAHRYWRMEVLAIHGPTLTFLLQQGKCGLSKSFWGPLETNAGQAASSEAFESVAGMFASGTRWSTNFSGYEWVSVDLGSAKPVVEFRLMGNSSFPDRTVKDFNLQWSDDGAHWNTSAIYRGIELTTNTSYSFPLYQNTHPDDFFDFNDVLIHFNGANGSTVMVDEVGHTIGINGTANISTVYSRFGGSSLECLNNGAWVDVSGVGDLGQDDFTIEFWLRNNGDHLAIPIDYRPSLTSGYYPCIVVENGTLYPFVNNVALIPASSRIEDDVFHFVRWSRFNGVSYFHIDETLVGSAADTNTYIGSRLRIGSSGYDPSTVSGLGYLDEVRITRGISRRFYELPQTAEWGGSPTTTVDRYYDNAYVVMNWTGVSGGTTFTDSTGYHTFAANAGPVLDGANGVTFSGAANQYLRTAADDLNYLMGDFCIEFTFKCSNGSGNRYLFAYGNNVLLCTISGNTIKIYTPETGTGGSLYLGPSITDATEYAVVIQRKNGVLSAWLNGVMWGSQAAVAIYGAEVITIGNNGDNSVPFIGTIGPMRFTKTFRYAAATNITQNASPYPTVGEIPLGSIIAKKWRVFVTNNNNSHSSYTTMAEVQLRRLPHGYDMTNTAGLDTAPFGSAIVNSSNDFKYAFDKNMLTKWTSNAEFPCWIGWDFKFPTRVMEMVLSSHYSTGDQPTLAARDFKLQYYDETAAAWVSVTSVAKQDAWAGGEKRTYQVRAPNNNIHDFWRMNVTANNGGPYVVIAEMELRSSTGGSDQTSPANAVAKSFASDFIFGNDIYHAFDDDTTTAWGVNYDNTLFIGWHEHLAVREIAINAIGSTGSPTYTAKDFTFEYSDDGVSYTVVKDVTADAVWAANEVRTYSW